jgi:hypothetical protein
VAVQALVGQLLVTLEAAVSALPAVEVQEAQLRELLLELVKLSLRTTYLELAARDQEEWTQVVAEV